MSENPNSSFMLIAFQNYNIICKPEGETVHNVHPIKIHRYYSNYSKTSKIRPPIFETLVNWI